MKVKLKKLVGTEGAIQGLLAMGYDSKFSFHLVRTVKPIREELENYNEAIMLIVEQYKGDPQGDGSYLFDKKNQAPAFKAIEALKATEIEIDTPTISLATIEEKCKGEVNINALLDLSYLITVEEAEKKAK